MRTEQSKQLIWSPAALPLTAAKFGFPKREINELRAAPRSICVFATASKQASSAKPVLRANSAANVSTLGLQWQSIKNDETLVKHKIDG
jgi:hypothetical protein